MRSVTLNFTDWLKQSSDVRSDISFDILSDISSEILSDISFDILSDISSDILSDISKTKHSIHSVTHKSHSTNSIFTSHHAAKVISMTTLCLSNGNSSVAFDCIRPPRQKSSWVPRCHASEHTAATRSHGVCKPWSRIATVPLTPLRCNWPCSAQHWFAIHALQPPKRTPKFERLEHAAPTLARPPHLEQLSLRIAHATKFPPQPLAQWTYNPQHA